MNHQEASGLLVDLASGRLPAALAGEVRRHAASCGECRALLETASAVRGEVTEFSSSLFTPHPSSDALAAYAITPSGLGPEQAAEIRIHARACPTCALEIRSARDAGRSAWRRAIASWFARPSLAAGRLAPVLTALLLLLAYPAYLGLFELPRVRDRHAFELQRRPTPAVAAPMRGAGADRGGAARALVLQGAVRGQSESPTLEIEPGQRLVPVLLDIDLSRQPAGDSLRVGITRSDGSTVWGRTLTVASLWDPETRTATLLVPAEDLQPGSYETRLARGRAGAVLLDAPFRVVAPRR